MLIVIADVAGRRARFLAGLFSFGVLIAMTAAQLAVVRLPDPEPDLERPFRVPGSVRVGGADVPVLPIVGAILTFGLWITSMFTHGGGGDRRLPVAGVRRGRLPAVAAGRRRDAAGARDARRAGPGGGSEDEEADREVERILVPLKLGIIGQEVLATAVRLAGTAGPRSS